jgi:hypothetical protein
MRYVVMVVVRKKEICGRDTEEIEALFVHVLNDDEHFV